MYLNTSYRCLCLCMHACMFRSMSMYAISFIMYDHYFKWNIKFFYFILTFHFDCLTPSHKTKQENMKKEQIKREQIKKGADKKKNEFLTMKKSNLTKVEEKGSR